MIEMEKNTYHSKALGWMERCAAADSFTVPHAHIFGHVVEYLKELTGEEDKKVVAKKVAKIVEKTAPEYINCTPPEIGFTTRTFQTLVDEIQD
jgi:hypothetical protein